MKDYPKILAAIAQVKGAGFWSGNTEKRIRRVAKSLLKSGATEEEVANAIREFWSIGQIEYGE